MILKFFIKSLLAFFLLLFTSLYFISYYDNLDKYRNNDTNILSLRYKNDFDSLDILFVGNSYCYSGIIPSYFDSINYKTYNLGIATAGPFFYELIVNEYLKNCKKQPKAIYFLISPTTFSSMSDNFLAYPVHRYLKKPVSNEHIAYHYNLYDIYGDMVQKSFKKGFINLISKKYKQISKSDLTSSKGYRKSNEICTEKTIQQTQELYYPLREDIFSQTKLDYFSKYLRNLKNNNIEVVIFDLPTNKLINYFNPMFISRYNSVKNNLSKEYKFISLDTTLPSLFFQNIDHLNESGAKIVTNMLSGIVNSNQNESKINISNNSILINQ